VREHFATRLRSELHFLHIRFDDIDPGAISATEISAVDRPAAKGRPQVRRTIAEPMIKSAVSTAALPLVQRRLRFRDSPSDTILIAWGGATRCSTCPSTVSLGPEGLHAAVLSGPELIERLYRDRPVPQRRHHDGAALARRAIARVSASSPSYEIGVRLIQDNKERIAVERPRQRHALRLPGRKRGACSPNLGVVAVAHLDNHLVNARLLRGGV